jgi:hypothetical protein
MKSLALALVAITGCALDYDPDVGEPIAGPAAGCSNEDSNAEVSVSFAFDIRPLFSKSPGGCAPCHMGRVTSGLEMSSYEALRRGGTNSGAKLVIDDDPCNSIFLKKLGRTPPFGSRMPFNGPPYYTPEEIQLVRDWIAEGAQNN